MNILFIVAYVPNLIYVRPYNLIRHLAQRGHRVHLLTLTANQADQQSVRALQSECEVTAFPMPRLRSMLNAALTLPTPYPLQASYSWNPAAARWLDERLHQEVDDVVHVEHLRSARYALRAQETLRKLGRATPLVWDAVDCISHLFRQAASRSRRLTSRLITALETGRTARYEGQLIGKLPQVLVTSPIDRQAMLKLAAPGSKPNIQVLPNGSDLTYFCPDPGVAREPATLVVSGKMSYHANVTMTLYLAKEILPLVWAQRPDVKLWVVGKDPTPEIVALGENPAVTVTGMVDDLRPYLRRATLAVAPIQYGAGIQNKVLEALACGTPVICTTQAVSALEIRPGSEIVTADSPQQFAENILTLLADPARRQQISQAGLAYVRQNHDWANIAARLENIYGK
jgi:sugar transferase (PEP-CTERM/EpsH1 system associated)